MGNFLSVYLKTFQPDPGRRRCIYKRTKIAISQYLLRKHYVADVKQLNRRAYWLCLALLQKIIYYPTLAKNVKCIA